MQSAARGKEHAFRVRPLQREQRRRRRGSEYDKTSPMAGAFNCHLVVMAKAPVAGRVKTRLAQGIGYGRATNFYRSTLAAVVERVTLPRQWRTYLAVTPDIALSARVWPAQCLRLGQGTGDLGQRMQRVMDRLTPGPVVIIGSDVPGITAAHIARAFRALKAADAVIGPSTDGGYWLIGLRRRPRVVRLFDGVRWSHSETLADTLKNAKGLRVARLEELDDIDEPSDYVRLGGSLGRRILARTS